MSSFKNADAGVIVDQLIKTIQKERDYLSEIDGKIGDGDHGINMNKGFTMCEKKLEGTTYNLSEGLTTLGETLLEDIGGSMGPLYGMLFDEMAQACEDEEEITADVFAEMITASVEGIQDISPAQVGDKSLLDTLIPAKEAFVEAKEAGKDFAECLDAMNVAAEKGWQSTKDLVAKIGRASRLGERSRGVLDKANELYTKLKDAGFRVKLDDSENSAGWKFAEYEMKGVPVRVEIGPKDIEAGQCVVATRHNGEKTTVSLDALVESVQQKLVEVHDGLYANALANRERRTYACTTMDEITEALEKNGDGFIKAMWCGDEACEDKVKEVTGVGSRCIPLEQEHLSDKCVCCGKPAKAMVYWGKAY
mgnify:CR=1 FL=1